MYSMLAILSFFIASVSADWTLRIEAGDDDVSVHAGTNDPLQITTSAGETFSVAIGIGKSKEVTLTQFASSVTIASSGSDGLAVKKISIDGVTLGEQFWLDMPCENIYDTYDTCLNSVTYSLNLITDEPTPAPTVTTTTISGQSVTCTLTDLMVDETSEFAGGMGEGGMGDWNCYDRIDTGSSHGSCHVHGNYHGHPSVAHIHGNCPTTQGGIYQSFETTAGTTYKLNFVAFAGDWDGKDTDSVLVMIENSDQDDWNSWEIPYGSWENVELTFVADGSVRIIIWADVGNCIDVDDITLSECTYETTTTTAKPSSSPTVSITDLFEKTPRVQVHGIGISLEFYADTGLNECLAHCMANTACQIVSWRVTDKTECYLKSARAPLTPDSNWDTYFKIIETTTTTTGEPSSSPTVGTTCDLMADINSNYTAIFDEVTCLCEEYHSVGNHVGKGWLQGFQRGVTSTLASHVSILASAESSGKFMQKWKKRFEFAKSLSEDDGDDEYHIKRVWRRTCRALMVLDMEDDMKRFAQRIDANSV